MKIIDKHGLRPVLRRTPGGCELTIPPQRLKPKAVNGLTLQFEGLGCGGGITVGGKFAELPAYAHRLFTQVKVLTACAGCGVDNEVIRYEGLGGEPVPNIEGVLGGGSGELDHFLVDFFARSARDGFPASHEAAAEVFGVGDGYRVCKAAFLEK